ncbi:phospho-N-acetylmuramoyl-pentapeptide-transferase, partial [Chlamydiota bacterium]
MLYHLLYPLKTFFIGFNVFRYITFRAAFAAITSMLITIIIGPYVIRKLTILKFGQEFRSVGPYPLKKLHNAKKGTPTMGGIIIIIALVISLFLWADLSNEFILLTIGTILYLGILGFWDDYTKISKKTATGLTGKQKLFFQILLAITITAVLTIDPETGAFYRKLTFPFFKHISIDLGPFYVLFVILIFVGCSNGVNLTDGLDGLAIG